MAEPAAAAPPAAAPSPAAQRRQQLQQIADELGTPGGAKLYAETRRRGLRISKQEIKDFLARKGEKQIFRPLPESKGKTASESIDMRFQMDLIDLKYSASKGFKYILVVVNVYTRRAYALPVRDKTPAQVAPVLQTLLSRMPEKPQVITSDRGNEFVGAVQTLLEEQGITQRMKSEKHDPNLLAVADRVIQNLKKRLAENLAKTPDLQEAVERRPGEWSDKVGQVTQEYNKTPHPTLKGEPPDQVRDNKLVNYLLDEDNAQKLDQNQKLFERRKGALQQEQAFRRPVGGITKFKRGFRASYGDVEQVTGFDGSKVLSAGEPIDVKRVMPVDKDSGQVEEGFALGEGRREMQKEKVADFVAEIYAFLGDDTRSMQAVSSHLKAFFPGDYQAYLDAVGAGRHLSNVVKLFDDLEQTPDGLYLRKV